MDRRAFVLSVPALLASRAHAQAKPELRLGSAIGPAFALGKAAERWAALLNERSAGAFEVRHHPGGTLHGRDPLREFGALRDGGADLAVGSALAWSSQLPAFGVYGLPWIAPESGDQDRLVNAPAVRALLDGAAAKAGVVVIAVAPLGERVVATFNDPVTSAGDLAGLRIRTITVPLIVETLSTLGARPEAMALAEAQAAFASRALGGQEGAPSTLAAARIGAWGLRTVTRWGAFADAMIFAMREPLWRQWNDAQQSAARDAAAEAARAAGAIAREEAALAELGKQGITVVRPTPAQREALRVSAEPVWSKWSAPIGPDLVAAAQAAVKP